MKSAAHVSSAQCGRSCKVYGDFSASSCLVIPAMKSGNIDLVTNAMAREGLTNKEGVATGVSYVNKRRPAEYQVEGRGYSARVHVKVQVIAQLKIATLSKRACKNNNGVVGKYLHDSTGADMGGIIPELFDRKRYNEDGVGDVRLYTMVAR